MLKKIIDQTQKPVFSINSNDSSFSIFEARKKFEKVNLLDIFLSIKKPVLCNLTGDQTMFGLIDTDGDYVVANKDFLVKAGGTQTDPLFLQDFVVDAFKDLKDYLKTSVIGQKLPSSSVYGNIKIKEAHTDIFPIFSRAQYSSYEYFKGLVDSSVPLNSKIKTHIDFNREYVKFLERNCTKVPSTFSETIRFFNLVKLSSGLIFSISGDDPGNDLLKFEKYYIEQELNCFHDACKRFGFKVDKRVPWILVADIDSPAMKKYLERYFVNSPRDLFSKRFVKAYLLEIETLKNLFYTFYEKFLLNNGRYYLDPSNLCYNHSRNPYYDLRKKTPEDIYFKDFNDKYWIRLYIFLRNLETGRGLKQNEFENTVREANEIYSFGKKEDAMKFINGIFRGYGFINNLEDALQPERSVVEVVEQPVGSLPKPKIIF